MPNLKIYAKTIEPEALAQIRLLLSQSAFRDCKVRIMPDVHAGKGCVIGFTANLGDKVIPNIVGVDIGCGMLISELGSKPIDLDFFDKSIRAFVPSGRNVHSTVQVRFPMLKHLRCYDALSDPERIECSVGTLGGGNHFIEIDRDEDGIQYLVIHTGSRSLGKQVAEYYQNLACDLLLGKRGLRLAQDTLVESYHACGKDAEIQTALKELQREYPARHGNLPKELCYLENEWRDAYLNDMQICQLFAQENRKQIRNTLLIRLGLSVEQAEGESFETVHNYIDPNSNIVRKGAIDASAGKRVLIPLNMRDGCIIAVGKGNEDWNNSAPHGAGRLMSRSQAKKNLSMEAYQSEMAGIFTTSVSEDTLDEAPEAYKPLAEILELIGETVEIERTIKPIYNFKASE